MPCDTASLINGSVGLQALSEKQLLAINTFLICELVSSGAGGNPPVIYTADPNTEGLKPVNTALPAVAYSSDGSGAFFGWSVVQQKWV